MKTNYVYIITNRPGGVLYVGVTSDLSQRIQQHKTHFMKGFSSQYNTTLLVYYQAYGDIRDAIAEEKKLKKWLRKWKVELIEKNNPEWKDLAEDM